MGDENGFDHLAVVALARAIVVVQDINFTEQALKACRLVIMLMDVHNRSFFSDVVEKQQTWVKAAMQKHFQDVFILKFLYQECQILLNAPQH